MNNFGILDDFAIRQLHESGQIKSPPLESGQVQPASLDLRLGAKAWRVRASFLPGAKSSVAEKLAQYQLQEIDLQNTTVLETNCVYIVLLQEELSLPENMGASTNPKSSTGRLDIFTRVIANNSEKFDSIENGYKGQLYLEISPRTFPIAVRAGSRLAQIRFRKGECQLNNDELHMLHENENLVAGNEIAIYENSLALSINLAKSSNNENQLIGYKANRHTGVVDVDKVAAYSAREFWQPIYSHANNLVLDPNEFYILASREAVHIPKNVAAEMVAFDPHVGEFRVHYAGFFDPGFGNNLKTKAVLEVRSHDVPFIVEHGQIVARLVYEKMLAVPKNLYGENLASNYQGQGLKLSKHFVNETFF